MMEYLGMVMLAFIIFVLLFIPWTWWQKFVNNRPARYGKGPGHDQRGPERGQWHTRD